MADASLDDFFAKKDKSKKKSKSKQTATDILEKLEDPNKPKKEKKKKDKEKTQTSSTSAPGATIKEEDEWLDFEEESEKDYSGLRIQNLQLASKEEEEEQEDSEGGEENEDGDNKEKQNLASGVWAVSQSAAPPTSGQARALGVGEISEAAPAPAKPKEESGKITGKYIPPGMRASLGGGGSSPVVSTQQLIRRKKEAPNIKSELDFPTLGGPSKADTMADYTGDEANYEHPGRGRSVQLSLENKFAALQD